MTQAVIHQIFYDDKTRIALDPGFVPLDNSANERPDWREYWPIRRYLLSNELEENRLHGFLSPRFGEKTRLTAKQVHDFLAKLKPLPDVVILNPHVGWDFSTLFLNVFEHGEHMHPGMMPASQAAFDAIGLEIDVASFVNDSRRAIFSNFFLASTGFWQQWLDVNEKLFALAEDELSPVGAMLRSTTSYRAAAGPVAHKVFIMERIATLLLARDQSLTVASVPSEAVLGAAPIEAISCDALKLALQERPDDHYKTAFVELRDPLVKRLAPGQRQHA